MSTAATSNSLGSQVRRFLNDKNWNVNDVCRTINSYYAANPNSTKEVHAAYKMAINYAKHMPARIELLSQDPNHFEFHDEEDYFNMLNLAYEQFQIALGWEEKKLTIPAMTFAVFHRNGILGINLNVYLKTRDLLWVVEFAIAECNLIEKEIDDSGSVGDQPEKFYDTFDIYKYIYKYYLNTYDHDKTAAAYDLLAKKGHDSMFHSQRHNAKKFHDRVLLIKKLMTDKKARKQLDPAQVEKVKKWTHFYNLLKKPTEQVA